MSEQFGYIYLRSHESYDKYNAYKLGKASNMLDRDPVYVTGEIERGIFIFVIRLHKGDETHIEEKLGDQFKHDGYHIYRNGGIEFYNKIIKSLIVPYLKKNNIWFEQLSDKELDELERTIRIKHGEPINSISNCIDTEDVSIKPSEHQLHVLDKCEEFYINNDTGKLIWSCGLGKTLLSILIVQKLHFNKITIGERHCVCPGQTQCPTPTNTYKVLVGVPSIFLQKQFMTEILKIYPLKKNILCVGGDSDCSTTNISRIKSFVQTKSNDPLFVITTYSSCYLLLDCNFDFIIGDEAHHLVGIDDETKSYKQFHNIRRNKALFMTATEKNIGAKYNQTVYSMDDDSLFGPYIDTKSVCWAIENKKITDYDLLILSNTEIEIDVIIRQLGIINANKDLFMATFMALKSIETYEGLTHILLCCNKTESADKVIEYANIILDKKILSIDRKDIYCESLHSNKKINIDPYDSKSEITTFKQSKYGIISSVYIFGEGFDLPKLNCVVFAENMISDIRIVQTALRPNRLNKDFPNKIARIIIPYLDCNDVNADSESFNRVRMIVAKLRNVDEQIEQKIHIAKCKIPSKSKGSYDWSSISINDDATVLNKIKLRLIHSKALGSHESPEQAEYNYVRELNREMHILSKEEYTNDKKIIESHKNYIPNPDTYFRLHGVWDNWYDFLGIDTRKFIQLKQDWIKFCRKYNVKTRNDYFDLCETYDCLPKEPSEFYKEFVNIQTELRVNKKRYQ